MYTYTLLLNSVQKPDFRAEFLRGSCQTISWDHHNPVDFLFNLGIPETRGRYRRCQSMDTMCIYIYTHPLYPTVSSWIACLKYRYIIYIMICGCVDMICMYKYVHCMHTVIHTCAYISIHTVTYMYTYIYINILMITAYWNFPRGTTPSRQGSKSVDIINELLKERLISVC